MSLSDFNDAFAKDVWLAGLAQQLERSEFFLFPELEPERNIWELLCQSI